MKVTARISPGRKAPARDLLRDPARDRGRLARAGAREDANGPADGLGGAPLLVVQALENLHPATLPGAPGRKSVTDACRRLNAGVSSSTARRRPTRFGTATIWRSFAVTPSTSFSATSASSSASCVVEPDRDRSAAGSPHDLRVLRLADLLVAVPELLVHLLAGARADELDLDLASSSSQRARERGSSVGARSTIFTGSPMSRTKTWPRPPIAPACTTSEAASGIVMKKRVISGCVTVTGPPRSIWLRKIGITRAGRAEHVAEADGDEARRDVVADGRTTRRSTRRRAFDWPEHGSSGWRPCRSR